MMCILRNFQTEEMQELISVG